jgi:hypothetical protein
MIPRFSKKKLIPENLVLSCDNIYDVLKSAELCITISSTAIIESAYAGIKSVVISDFGIRADLSNELFIGSNLFASFDDIINGQIPAINSDWVNSYAISATDNYKKLLEKLGSLLKAKQELHNVNKAPAKQYKVDIIDYIYNKRDLYGKRVLWKDLFKRKYGRLRRLLRELLKGINGF